MISFQFEQYRNANPHFHGLLAAVSGRECPRPGPPQVQFDPKYHVRWIPAPVNRQPCHPFRPAPSGLPCHETRVSGPAADTGEADCDHIMETLHGPETAKWSDAHPPRLTPGSSSRSVLQLHRPGVPAPAYPRFPGLIRSNRSEIESIAARQPVRVLLMTAYRIADGLWAQL